MKSFCVKYAFMINERIGLPVCECVCVCLFVCTSVVITRCMKLFGKSKIVMFSLTSRQRRKKKSDMKNNY